MSEVQLLRAVESDHDAASIALPNHDVVVPIGQPKKIPAIEFHKHPPHFGYAGIAHHDARGLPRQWRWNPKQVHLAPAVGRIDIVVNMHRHSGQMVMNANVTAFLEVYPELVLPEWDGLTLYGTETIFLEKPWREWLVGLRVTTDKGQRVLIRVSSCLKSSFGAGSRIVVYRP